MEWAKFVWVHNFFLKGLLLLVQTCLEGIALYLFPLIYSYLFLFREHGSKIGSGGVNSEVASKIDKRERLRQLALETIDLEKVPFIV